MLPLVLPTVCPPPALLPTICPRFGATSATTYNQRVLQSVHTGAIGHTTYNMSALWRHRCYYLHYVHIGALPAVLPTICPHRDATGGTTYNLSTPWRHRRYYLQLCPHRGAKHALLPTICPHRGATTYNMSTLWLKKLESFFQIILLCITCIFFRLSHQELPQQIMHTLRANTSSLVATTPCMSFITSKYLLFGLMWQLIRNWESILDVLFLISLATN